MTKGLVYVEWFSLFVLKEKPIMDDIEGFLEMLKGWLELFSRHFLPVPGHFVNSLIAFFRSVKFLSPRQYLPIGG